MKVKQIIAKSIIATVLAAVLSSCLDDCEEPAYPAIVAGTYLDGKSTLTFQGDTLIVKGLLMDQPIYRLNKLYALPFRLDTDSTSYVIELKGQTDTLTLYYQTWLEFLGEKCGCASAGLVDSLRYSRHMIDSVKIEKTEMGKTYSSGLKNNEENIRIYY